MAFCRTGGHVIALRVVALVLICVAPSAAVTPAAAEPVPLQLGYSNQESPLYIQGSGDVVPPLPGIAVEMVQAAATTCAVAASFARYPGGRLLALMQENVIDATVMLSFSPERLGIAAYPMLENVADPAFQIASLTYAFYVRSDSKLMWDGKSFTGLAHPIGANLGWSIANDLTKMGLPVEPAKDTQNNFNKLLLGRIDAFAIQTSIGDAYVERHQLGDRIKLLVPAISSKAYYLVFSHGWYDRHPDAAKCLWQSIAEQRENSMPALLQHYTGSIH